MSPSTQQQQTVQLSSHSGAVRQASYEELHDGPCRRVVASCCHRAALPLRKQHNCCHTANVLPSRFTHMLGLMTARTTEKRYFFHMETRMKLCAVFLILDYTEEERPRRPCYGLR